MEPRRTLLVFFIYFVVFFSPFTCHLLLELASLDATGLIFVWLVVVVLPSAFRSYSPNGMFSVWFRIDKCTWNIKTSYYYDSQLLLSSRFILEEEENTFYFHSLRALRHVLSNVQAQSLARCRVFIFSYFSGDMQKKYKRRKKERMENINFNSHALIHLSSLLEKSLHVQRKRLLLPPTAGKYWISSLSFSFSFSLSRLD